MDIVGILDFVRRRWVPLLLCLVAGLGGATVLSVSSAKTYQTSSRLFVNIPAARGVQEALQGVQLSSQLIDSYAKVAESRSNADLVAKELGGTLSPGQVRARLHAASISNTLLLDVTATDTNARRARELANASATVLIKVIDELEAGKQDAVQARVIDPAVTPSKPISPRPKVDLTIGLLLGLAAGAVVALGLDGADRAKNPPAPPGANGALAPLTDRVHALSGEVDALAGRSSSALGAIDDRLDALETPPPVRTRSTPATRATKAAKSARRARESGPLTAGPPVDDDE